ncbi:MAG: hypothetical protein JNL72_09475 [Flavipsychrobacter sp.]|nr:hypothetical protein [Flavipsychrobacter sp.]
MKKISTVIIALVAAVGFSSCGKNYTCTCSFNGNVMYEGESSGKRDDARTDCDLKKYTVAGQTWDCDLR